MKKKLKLFAGLSLTVAGAMHIANRFIYYISTADNLLSQKNSEFYHWRFGNICYTKTGTGTPILLVHDLNSSSSSFEWNKLIASLSKTNTVYALDLLGCGCSDKPNLTYTNYLYVQLITDFIKNVIKEKTDVIATGMSSSFILLACSNDDSIINKIVLVNPENLVSLAKAPTKRGKTLQYLFGLPVLGTFIYNLYVNRNSINEDFHLYYFYDGHKIDDKTIRTYFEASQRNYSHSKYLYGSIKSRYINANIVHCLKKLNNNIYIIVGSANPENMLVANQYQNQLPSIEISAIKNTKHLPQLEQPEEFTNQVKKLFEIE